MSISAPGVLCALRAQKADMAGQFVGSTQHQPEHSLVIAPHILGKALNYKRLA
jgi:hypothetical protein